MGRLIVVSNRVALPGKAARAGGLAVAMREALKRQQGLWFGWSGRISESREPEIQCSGQTTYVTIDLTAREHETYYLGYANGTLWPLFHYRLGLIEFHREWLDGYLQVNRRMAELLQPFLRDDDVIWVHDYHLIPLGEELRRLGVRCRIGFFLHIPLPAAEVLVSGPGHAILARSLCAYDLIGFQTVNDVRAFADYVVHEAGGHFDAAAATVHAFGRHSRVGAFPIGIDGAQFARDAATAADSPETRRLRDSLRGRDLIIGVDRLDYSKGLLNRLDGFGRLLEAWPQHRGRVALMQITPPSREDVQQYRRLRKDLDRRAGQINGRFAEFDWMPVRYLNRSFSRTTLAGFYRVARVGLITPLRDGMNLVAKEYVAAQDPDDPGVLVLSRNAGAARQLDAALIVNPLDADELAQALHAALTMPLAERQLRWQAMEASVMTSTIATWRRDFLAALQDCPAAAAAPFATAG